MYVNRVLRSRTGEDSLDTLRASREVRAREGVSGLWGTNSADDMRWHVCCCE